jgi:CheY-like chemotaxis protein
MPEMDGAEFCRTMRTSPEYERYRHIPIVLISGYTDQRIEYADRFVQKPLNTQTLKSLVHQYVSARH